MAVFRILNIYLISLLVLFELTSELSCIQYFTLQYQCIKIECTEADLPYWYQ